MQKLKSLLIAGFTLAVITPIVMALNFPVRLIGKVATLKKPTLQLANENCDGGHPTVPRQDTGSGKTIT